MARSLAKLRPFGIENDKAAIDTPETVYTSGSNMIVHDRYMERSGGLEDVFNDPIGPPKFLLPIQTLPAAFWVYATTDELVGVTDGVLHNDITPAVPPVSLTSFNNWTGSIFNSVPVINPGDSDPLFWDLNVGNPCLTLPGWEVNAKCGAMRPFLNYLFALDYTDGAGDRNENLVKWSDSADPGTLPAEWTAAADNDAGEISLASTPGSIIDAHSLRNSFIVYKQDASWVIEFVGGQFVFSARKLFLGSGMISRNCWAVIRGVAVVMTDGDVIMHDGHTAKSIIDERNRRLLFDNISTANYRNSFVAVNAPNAELWFCVPTGTNTLPSIAVVWNWEDDAWGVRDLFDTPFGADGILPEQLSTDVESWADQTDTWQTIDRTWGESAFSPIENKLVLADLTTGFSAVDVGGSDANGNIIEAILNRDSLDFGDAELVKTVRAVWPRIDAPDGTVFDIRVGGQMNQNEPISWSAPILITIGTDRKADVFVTGRLLSFRFNTFNSIVWRMSGFDVEFADSVSQY